MNAATCVYALVVTYRPDTGKLRELLEACRPQVAHVLIIDNGSDAACTEWIQKHSGGNVSCLLLGKNLGVATAHNRGIAWARERGATHVVQFDQDSIPAPDMIERLVAAGNQLESQGRKVAAVGPEFFDPRYLVPARYVRLRGFWIEKNRCRSDTDIQEADYIITSGSLISLAAIEAIGGLDEGLFVDYIDIEWGLRAKALGYHCHGVCCAKMRHDLGDDPVRLLGIFRMVPVRSPLRHYYLFRNAVLLYKRKYIPFFWKLNDGYRLFLKYIFYCTFITPRWAHLKMMSYGIWHGIQGRDGPVNSPDRNAG